MQTKLKSIHYNLFRRAERGGDRGDDEAGGGGSVPLLIGGPRTKEDSECVSRCDNSDSRCVDICAGMEARYFSISEEIICSSLPAQVLRIVLMPAIFSGMPIAM